MYNPGIAGVIFIPSAEETNTCIQSESINKEKLCQSAFLSIAAISALLTGAMCKTEKPLTSCHELTQTPETRSQMESPKAT